VYNPLQTKLLQQARRSQVRGVGGLGMLVHQGALSFKMWTKVEAPVRVMRAACVRSLQS
jgi:shikimate dehydrogenase